MKILLTAINAKYIHSNLAVYSLRSYAKPFHDQIELAEYTINHQTDDVLSDIYTRKPDVLCFSCYIWNISVIRELIRELRLLRPELPIWVGGPEVSYECGEFLKENPRVTGIMRGEGEATFLELCEHYVNQENELSKIRGLVFRDEEDNIVFTPERPPLSLDALPFCYEDLADFEHRIIYYESSRGCPFRCSYCLSSVEKSLRFRSLPLVYRELQFFLDHKVPQVKFVDRTFNCDHVHAMAIWEFLREHDNGITNFHFEISADLLTDEEIALLATLRPGLIQLEIGVQSTNPQTVEEIRRSMNLERLEAVVRKIKSQGNIHQHLDLIAGLPYEDYRSFAGSFDQIYALHPEQLQLGFLKVLKGSWLYENRDAYGIICHEAPPYEVMATRWLSYDELLEIKKVEEMLEVYYNSGQFTRTMQVLEQAFDSHFTMFWELGQYYERNHLFDVNHSRIRRSEILLEFIREKSLEPIELYQETLTFDLYCREKMKSRPAWAPEPSLFKEELKHLKEKNPGLKGRNVHLEPFYYDLEHLSQRRRTCGEEQDFPRRKPERSYYLFDYENRNPLTGQANVTKLCGKQDPQ